MKHSERVHFIIVSDDQPWVTSSLKTLFPFGIFDQSGETTIVRGNVLVTQSYNRSAAVDFAILTMCDGLVLSTGSFGWWAAWLANKTTVYYAGWPRQNSRLARVTDLETYFPPDWIPIK